MSGNVHEGTWSEDSWDPAVSPGEPRVDSGGTRTVRLARGRLCHGLAEDGGDARLVWSPSPQGHVANVYRGPVSEEALLKDVDDLVGNAMAGT